MTFTKPLENALQMGLHEGMKVVDLGAGVGHYAFCISRIVGPSGRVYAVDVQQDVLTHLKGEAARKKLKNIETVWGDIEKAGGTMLRDRSIDAAVLSNTLFQLSNKEEAIQEILRILKENGTLLVIDWAGSYGGIGPQVSHVVSERDAEDLFIGAGFRKKKSFRGGPHHYALLFSAP